MNLLDFNGKIIEITKVFNQIFKYIFIDLIIVPLQSL